MATFQNKSFTNQTVLVDGNRYELCSFSNCSLVYQGGELPTFDRCMFRAGTIQLDGAAYQTVKYLNGLYRGGLAASVDAVLKEVQRGNEQLAERPAAPPAEYTGTNFGQLGRIAAVAAVITILLSAALWYGGLEYPQNIALEAEPARPLSEQISLSIMPALPDELGDAYDALRADQTERLNDIGWIDRGAGIVRLPIDTAMGVMAAQGAPTWAAAEAEGE